MHEPDFYGLKHLRSQRARQFNFASFWSIILVVLAAFAWSL